MKVTRPPGRDPAAWHAAKKVQGATGATRRNGNGNGNSDTDLARPPP